MRWDLTRRHAMERIGLLVFTLTFLQLLQPHGYQQESSTPSELLHSLYNPKFVEVGYNICDLHYFAPVAQSSLIAIHSPRRSNDSDLYPPNLNCSVLVRATEPDAQFNIKFTHLHIENSDDRSCVRDSRLVEERSAATTGSAVVAECCGSACTFSNGLQGRSWKSQGSEVRLTFRTDSQIEKTGFKVVLSQYLPVYCISGEQNMEATTDSIISLYRPNADSVSLCYVNVTSRSSGRTISMDFKSFQLDYSGSSCVYDRLEMIHVINNETFIDYGCGLRTPFYYHINSETASIAYRTDGKSTSQFSIRYADVEKEEWEYRRRIDEFQLMDGEAVSIDLSDLVPNYITELHNEHMWYHHSTYIFKFETIYARKLSASLSFVNMSSANQSDCYKNLVVAYSDRLMTSPTPKDLRDHNYMNEPDLTGLTCLDRVTFDRLSPEMMVFVFSLNGRVSDQLVLTVRASRLREREKSGTSSPRVLSSPEASFRNVSFVYMYKDLLARMHEITPRQRSVQVMVPLPIKSTDWKSDLYFNFTQFGLYKEPHDPSCRMSGFVIILTDADGNEESEGPYCSSPFPIVVMARNRTMETWIYYYEDSREQEQVVPDGVVIRFHVNRYICDHVNFWKQQAEVRDSDCVVLQSPAKKSSDSLSNHSVTFITQEPYLVFSLFTSRFLPQLMSLNESQSLPGPLAMFEKTNCSSSLNFVRQAVNGSFLVTVSYSSTCDYSPDHWTIHLEQKCRMRVPHNEIKSVNTNEEQIVQTECGFLETPNYPFAYQNYEEPLVWIFDPLRGQAEHSSLSQYYEFSLDVFNLDVCLNSKLLMSESINGSFSKETTLCGYKKGERFSTISSQRLLLMFLASKISQTKSSYEGFSISFKLKQDTDRMEFKRCKSDWPDWVRHNDSCYIFVRPSAPVSWDGAAAACKELGGDLVSIQSQEEMNAIKQMLLHEWYSEAFAHSDVFIYIGLRARPEIRLDLLRRNFYAENYHLSNNFEWVNGEPFVFHEWFPSHYETVYSRSSPNVQAFINEGFPQPSNDPNYPCVGMMLHNPRHHSNWIKVPCNIEIKGQSHICERPADDNRKSQLVKHFEKQLAKIRTDGPACTDNWIEKDRQCYMLVTLNSTSQEQELTAERAGLMCERLSSQIATLPKEHSKMAPYNQMLQVWRYSVQRGRIIVYSSDRSFLGDAGSDEVVSDEFFNVFTPISARQGPGGQDPASTIKATAAKAPREDSGIRRLPSRSVLCVRSPVSLPLECRSNQFACLDKTCISSDGQCDGRKDCPSGEDEMDCSSDIFDQFFECGSNDSERITWSKLCDHKEDCSNGMDEANCQFGQCRRDEFQCERSKECIPAEHRCNGVSTCQDLTDEKNCETCNGFQCLSGRCIPNGLVNDTQVDCPGSLLEDEAMTCLRANNCTRGEDVIDPDSLEFPDCPDSLSERCMFNHVKCFPRQDACVFDRRQFGKQVCPNMEHLRSCNDGVHGFGCGRLFQCPAGYCVPVYRLCDGVQDCSDAADEVNCTAPPLLPGHLRCLSPNAETWAQIISVPVENACDGVAHCRDGEDEAFCDMECRQPCKCRGYITECLRPLSFSINQTVSPLTRALYLSGNTQLTARPGDFDRLPLLGLLEMRSTGLREIAVGLFSRLANLRYLDLSNNAITVVPSNVWSGLVRLNTLLIKGNPIATIESFGFAHLPLVTELDLSNLSIASLPSYAFYGSNNTRHLNLSRNPLTTIDQLAFSGGPRQLSTLDLSGTGNDVYIPIGTFSELSRVGNLYTDSFKFCCLAEGVAVNCTPPADGFSSCYDLLGDLAQQVMIWIFGCLALVGNLFVITWRLVKKLFKKTTDFLILNLSLADLLMAVYLLIIAGTDTSYRHVYIAHDDQWRASSLCTVCAILATVSSEVSVTILAFLSYDRYKLTVQRFKQHGWTLHRVAAVVGITWLMTCGFSLLSLSTTVRKIMPYYLNAACSPFYLDSQLPMIQRAPQLIAIVYNCASFAFMAGCYLRVFLHLKSTRRKAKRKAMDMDHLMARRLFLLVLTDLICWLPTIILFLLVSSGYKISRTTTTGLVIFALPINSALNPYLYTVSRLRMFCRESKEKLHRRQALETISAYLENRRRLSSSRDLAVLEPRLSSPSQSQSQSQACAQTQTNFGFEFDEPVQLHHRSSSARSSYRQNKSPTGGESVDEESDVVFL